MKTKKSHCVGQNGRSMIEMLGVLAIVGVLSVGGLAGYNMAMGRVRENRFVEEFETVIFTAGEFFSDLGVLQAQNFDFVDLRLLKQVASAISGEIVVNPPAKAFDTSPYHFYISFRNLPNSLCLRLVSIPFGQSVCVDDGSGSDLFNMAEQPKKAQTFCNRSDKANATTRFMFGCHY